MAALDLVPCMACEHYQNGDGIVSVSVSKRSRRTDIVIICT